MNQKLRRDADAILTYAINEVKPDAAVKKALEGRTFPGRVYIAAAGKAAYQMAEAAAEVLACEAGIVVTKYGHVKGEIPGFRCFEAGHPIPDANGFAGTQAILDMTENLKKEDTVVFLLSGGGSALFELPLVSGDELQQITAELLKCGADINEINTLRKRLSGVKGGRFARHVFPARVLSVILSDIIGDPLDMIASGPTVADSSTCEEAVGIIRKYQIPLSAQAEKLMQTETPKQIENSEALVIGSVRELCRAAEVKAAELGYETVFLTDRMCCEARDAGILLGNIARSHSGDGKKIAYILGGETVVHLKGSGKGGRNQEIAAGAIREIAGLLNTAVFSVGSDGTDGPCDAAGGYVDGDTLQEIDEKKMNLAQMQADNDCYHLLAAVGGLIITGPTGTNVNDLSMILID